MFPSAYKDRINGKALKIVPRTMSLALNNYKCIFDEYWSSMLLDSQSMHDELVQLKFRDVSAKFITRVTQDNIEYCTRLMKYVDLRHFGNITGYLGIRDSNQDFVYITSPLANPSYIEPAHNISDIIVSSSQSFVQMQNNLFDEIWSLATPALHVIADLARKQYAKKIINKSIKSLEETCSVISTIVDSSQTEILIVFPYSSVFWSASNLGIIKLLHNKLRQNVTVRVIVLFDRSDKEVRHSKERIRSALREENNDLYFNIAFLTKDVPGLNMFFIIDQAIMLSAEVIDKTKEAFVETLGMAMVSNDRNKISATLSAFEILWIQSELEKQNQIKQTYFHIFKGFKLKGEKYRRKWLFEQSRH